MLTTLRALLSVVSSIIIETRLLWKYSLSWLIWFLNNHFIESNQIDLDSINNGNYLIIDLNSISISILIKLIIFIDFNQMNLNGNYHYLFIILK